MRILFVGDFDLAGQAIATRLYREGNRVCWLTREKQKNLWGQKVSGRVFRREITYRTCRQILQGESIDCILFLTAPWREDYLDQGDQDRPPLLSLLNPVLRAAGSLKMECVCLLSSLDLESEELAYGLSEVSQGEIRGAVGLRRKDALLSPTLEELRAGERVLRSFCRENRLPALILRVGCLFGEAAPEDAGFGGQIALAMERGQTVRCPFEPEASFDFLCASDLADAVYRLFDLRAQGLYEVVVGRPVTARQLCDLTAQAAGFSGEVEYGDRPHGCRGARAQALRDLCGWMPFYLFQEQGPELIRKGAAAAQGGAGAHRRPRGSWRKRWPLLTETLQNLLLFALTLVVSSFAAGWEDLRYVDVRLLYVMVVAISFGMRQGLLATVLAIASYVAALARSQIDLSYLSYSIESWIPFLLYGVAGAFAGYWSDKKNDDYESLLGEYQEQGDRYEFLKELYREVLEVKNHLQKQIVISRDSLAHLYAITEELNSTSPRVICLRTIGVMEEIMECSSAALYLKPRQDSSYGRLMACSAGLSHTLAPSIDFRAHPKLWQAMEEKKLYVNTELDPDSPALAMPVQDGEESVALAVLYQLPPDRYTVYYRNLFQTLVRLIQGNLARAFRYQEDNREKLYLPGTCVLAPEAFSREWALLKKAHEEDGYPVSAAQILPEEPLDFSQLCRRASPLLRGTDLLGAGEQGQLWTVFLYVNQGSRPILEKRFAEKGLSLRWEA